LFAGFVTVFIHPTFDPGISFFFFCLIFCSLGRRERGGRGGEREEGGRGRSLTSIKEEEEGEEGKEVSP
jgi:hypothetical protein